MITIYEATATDFGGNGLGTLAPESCLVSETLNGEYEVTLVHPIDEAGKFRRLQENRILRVPVPAGKTPRMAMSAQKQTSTEIYKVTTGGMRLYLRAQPSQSAKGLHAYKPNTEVVLIAKTNAQWYEVTTPDGKHGYMYAANLTYVRTETTGAAAEEAIKEPTTLRDQPFRIYRIVPTLTNITVYARHIFYDLMDNMVSSYAPDANTTGAAALTGLMAAALSAQDFTFYSDLDTTAEGVEITDKNPAEAILGDGGLIENYGGELARDWWDVYLAKRAGEETGIQIREGKNLTGITYSVDYTNVTTRIMPRGEDKDGKPLYLPEKYIDSENISAYPTIKWALMDVKDAKEKTKGDDRRTKEECYALMRQAAQDAYDAGDDLPDVTLNVSFIDCAETEEYSQYRNLQGIHLGDTVKVIAKRIGVSVAMRMTQYTYNCLTRRYEAMTLGTIDDGIEGNMISPRSIGSGSISGRMIKLGSIGTGALQDGAVNSLKIALAAIEYAHINEATINKLNADSLTAQIAHINALTAGTIDADKLTAAWAKLYTIIAGQIEAGTVTADTLTAAMAKLTKASVEYADIDWANISKLTAAMANIATARIGDADIDFAQIKQMKVGTAVADQLITHDAVADRYFIDKLQVRALQVLEQTVGSLTVKASDGNYYRLDIDPEAGTVVPTLVTPSDDEKAEGVTGDQSRCIIETDLTVADLAATNVKAINALIDKLTASRIEVDTLFAREATVGALDAYLVRASTIEALEGQLNVWANEKVNLAVGALAIGGTNLVTLGDLAIVNATGRAAEYIGKDWYRESEHQTTISPYSGVCWLQCPGVLITAGRKYTLSFYAWIQPGAAAGDVKFRPNLWGGTSDTDKYLTDFIPFVLATPTKYTVTFDTTGWTTGTYALRFVMLTGQTHEVYFTDIKLEEGTKATAWSPSPNEVRIGSNILLDLYHTMLKTPYFEVDVSGENGDFKADETGLSAKVGTFEVLNAPDVARYYTGPASITLSAGADVKIMSDALSNRILTGDVTIGITGEVSGALELRGIGGYGRITINGGGNTLNGYINLYCNSVPIEINSVKVSRSTQRQCINVNNCTEVKTYACVFNANASSGNAQGFRSTYSGLFIQNCEFYNIPDSAMAFSYGTDALVLGCKGAATYCFWYDGATLRVAGSRPSGICAGGNPSFLVPSDPSTIAVDTGSAAPVETPVTTASYTATTTGTYYPSGHWINDNTIRQGHEGTGSNGRKDYGCMWFAASALAGKTIKSATLTIKRIAGKGRSSSVTMKLWTTTLTGKSGKPTDSLVSLGEIGKIANGETATFNVPTSAISVIAAGGGLVLYTEETTNKTGKTYSENYAHFEGTDGSAPVLTVTYQ